MGFKSTGEKNYSPVLLKKNPAKIPTLLSTAAVIEPDETAVVCLCQAAHQRGEAHRARMVGSVLQYDRKAHGVDADPALPGFSPIQFFHGIQHTLDGSPGEVITKDIQADFFVRCVESADRGFDPLHRT